MQPQPMTRRGPTLSPRPPLAAYRDDLARAGARDEFGPSDATWLAMATILSHGVDIPAESRPSLSATLREVVGGDPALKGLLDAADREPAAEFELDAVSPIVRAVVEQMEDEGALSLAYSTLSILANADLRLSALEQGRVLAQLGRVAWKAGALETSREHYRRVEVLGRVAQSSELRVRAWIGYSIVARHRGNYPEVRKWATRAAHEAERAALPALASLAYYNLMVSSGVAGDFNGSLVYGWHAFQSAKGDPVREAEMLLNLSQLLLESGHPDAAIHGFSAALARRPPALVALPALGGLACAAAILGDAIRARDAWQRTQQLLAEGAVPYHAASALLEFAQALSALGDLRLGTQCRRDALELAERHGYHEITHRAQTVRLPGSDRAGAPHVLDSKGAEVVRAVASLDPVSAA